jgi:hypothetical protein
MLKATTATSLVRGTMAIVNGRIDHQNRNKITLKYAWNFSLFIWHFFLFFLFFFLI